MFVVQIYIGIHHKTEVSKPLYYTNIIQVSANIEHASVKVLNTCYRYSIWRSCTMYYLENIHLIRHISKLRMYIIYVLWDVFWNNYRTIVFYCLHQFTSWCTNYGYKRTNALQIFYGRSFYLFQTLFLTVMQIMVANPRYCFHTIKQYLTICAVLIICYMHYFRRMYPIMASLQCNIL